MDFHFNISPPKKQTKLPGGKVVEAQEKPCLSLTCFSPNVKLDFENVVVGTTLTQEVLLENPSSHDMTICVTNLPAAEQGVTVNWHEQLIQSHSTTILEISWKPLMESAWRHSFKLEDGHRIKKNISAVFKSIKASKKMERKTIAQRITKSKCSKLLSKENLDPNPDTFMLSINNSFSINYTNEEIRRDTYTISAFKPIDKNTTLHVGSIKNNSTFTIAIRDDLDKTISKDFSDDSLEVIMNKTTSSPIISNRNSTYVLTPEQHTVNEFSCSFGSSATKFITHTRTVLKLKRRSNSIFDVSPPKRLQLDFDAEKYKKSCRSLNRSSLHKKTIYNPYLLSTDPFLTPGTYYDTNWVTEQEEHFKKWLNCLLTPPAELHSNTELKEFDPAKLWQECKNKPEGVLYTKEMISLQYHKNSRLDALRLSAKSLYSCTEITSTLSKVYAVIDADKMSIRTDRNIHANVGLQAEILRILFCYNPLWLRIGLETIYNTTILLSSNSDIVGLTKFIIEHFFKDTTLIKKYKNVYSPKYVNAIKQSILKRFLSLVYFLDIAKTRSLIQHDPCLFCKNAPIKETKQILFAFARELIAAIGDITRFLRRFGYTVEHEQKFIHEFDFSIIHLGSDLLDGVRLTKVIEILLLQTDLIEKLRVPAISKLQKIHNVEVTFTALENANFTIVGDITPKDIVEGHHEKTLSFLWQIVYKFQAPILIKAAITIQTWWRSFPIVVKRSILNKPHKAATKIQKCVKMYLQKRKYTKMKKSALVIQAFVRMTLLRNEFVKKQSAAITIQTAYRSYMLMKIQKAEFTRLKQATIFVQRCFRVKIRERAATIIQQRYRAQVTMKIAYTNFISMKAAALCIQRYFRARKEIRFVQMRSAAITIQRRFRANRAMATEQTRYLALKAATITIQNRFRANQTMKHYHSKFINLKVAALKVQQRFRANCAMKLDRSKYSALKHAAVIIQTRFRALRSAKVVLKDYRVLRKSAIIVQRRFRANKCMKHERCKFLSLKHAVTVVQQRFRANLAMKRDYFTFITLKTAALKLQQRFKANCAMKQSRSNYLQLKQATVLIQMRFRATQLAKSALNHYHVLRNAAIIIQRGFRAYRSMEHHRNKYLTLKQAVMTVQQRYRANRTMKHDRFTYINLKAATLRVQQRFRANCSMKYHRSQYLALKQAVLTVQIRFRANQLSKIIQSDYRIMHKSAVTVQRRFRANRSMKSERNKFLLLKQVVIFVQQRFRANNEMKLEHSKFCTLKQAVITVQRQFRAKISCRACYNDFQRLRNAALAIQRRFRANQLMKSTCINFTKLKQATITIQQQYRANKVMKPIFHQYKQLREATILVQQRFRANKARKIESWRFERIKKAAIIIQKAFRTYKAVAEERKEFLTYYRLRRSAAIKIQTIWRGYSVQKLHPEMAKIRKNSREVNLMAQPQQRLGIRKQQALLLLCSVNTSLLHIITALEDLDYITRRCKQACTTLSQTLPEVLYQTIESGNRSLPEMQACAAATGILINFFKYKPTSELTWIPQHIEKLFTILIHCCDKENKLFLYLCTLIWLFAHNEEYRKVICGFENFSLMLRQIERLCLRKHNMVLQQKYKHFSQFLPYRELPLPNCVPDWGLEYPQRPRLFTNSVQALNCLVKILSRK